MIKEYLNLEATDVAESMFGITQQRLKEINEMLFIADHEIATNHKQYTLPGTEDSPGDGLHVGKTLERILKIARTPNEELAILYAYSAFVDKVLDSINDVLIKEKIMKLHPEAEIITVKL